MPIATPTFPVPLVFSDSLPKTYSALTPAIGTEFAPETQVSSLLSSSAPSTSIRDLAILVSQRGVVFFREQDLTTAEQRELVDRLGKETGRPEESGLHVHPLGGTNELGGGGKEEVFKITAEFNGASEDSFNRSTRASNIWHSDISFENYPSDYAILKMNTLPKVGGDTLWASAYTAYDRLSPAMQNFLSTLTATHVGDTFHAPPGGKFKEPRGHPENNGQHLSASHPLIRTNPVTGWRGLYVNKFFTKRINELSVDESDHMLSYLFEHIAQNHDLTVRFRWQPGSLAIWDNRSTLHSATNDYGSATREGDRVVSVGEKPYYDPTSLSREAALRVKQD
ncbi:taurine catabolism dioxygenase [Mrakia frigida]|uniref:TauD/TfdA dioxygenase family protein n=1 Tax=Mrakia frigida TaxID=29902 RepID=UPI003FCBF687